MTADDRSFSAAGGGDEKGLVKTPKQGGKPDFNGRGRHRNVLVRLVQGVGSHN